MPVRPEPPTEAPSLTDDARWRAVLDRDPDGAGSFRLGVTTTGIYCRPGCPARTPKRENVRFFDDWAAAERAGFRACKRCHPGATAPRDPRADRVAAACRRIESEAEFPGLDDLAKVAHMSRSGFLRAFRAVVGVTPRAYAEAARAARVRDRLSEGDTATRAYLAAGYSSAGRFYEDAPKALGMSPTAFKSGAPGSSIRSASTTCTLGHLLIAATDLGVCFLALGDDPEALAADLRRRFPNADRIDPDPEFAALIGAVVASIADPRRSGLSNLPLDLRGTAFQRLVWGALREIPIGETTTYSALAARLGRPGSARAVALACASNPVAVAVPCHRVVRADGSLAGYRWGVERKAALLRREAPAVDAAAPPGINCANP